MESSGCLILVVGPSGAGKDSLIRGAAETLTEDQRFEFARRHITRPHDPQHEDHVEVSESQFENLARQGEFFLHWQAHGLCYGLNLSYRQQVETGKAVIANVSRTVIDEARTLPCSVFVVNVTAPEEVLAQRLSGRRREAPDDIARRLDRQVPLAGDNVFEVRNDRTLEDGVSDLVRLIRRLAAVAESCGPSPDGAAFGRISTEVT